MGMDSSHLTGPMLRARPGSSEFRDDGAEEESTCGFAPSPTRGPSRLLVDLLNGQADQFHTAPQLKLLLDMRTIGLNGLHAQMQACRDFASGAAAPDELKHLQFPIAQTLNSRR